MTLDPRTHPKPKRRRVAAPSRRPRMPDHYVEGVTCPACEEIALRAVKAHNAYSRFCEHYICATCGVREALDGFFWIERALARAFKLSKAGQEIYYGSKPDAR